MKVFSENVMWLIVGCLGVGTKGETQRDSPIVVHPWSGVARIQGAYLLTPIRIFLDKLCSDVITQLAVSNQSLLILNKSQPLVESKLFLRKIGFLILINRE